MKSAHAMFATCMLSLKGHRNDSLFGGELIKKVSSKCGHHEGSRGETVACLQILWGNFWPSNLCEIKGVKESMPAGWPKQQPQYKQTHVWTMVYG